MTQTASIIYHCHKRRQYFQRQIIVDDGPEVLARLEGLRFRTAEASGIIIVSISTIGARNVVEAGMSSSLPAHMFGPEYYRAHRVDTSKLWDWRRQSFMLAMSATEDKLMQLLVA